MTDDTAAPMMIAFCRPVGAEALSMSSPEDMAHGASCPPNLRCVISSRAHEGDTKPMHTHFAECRDGTGVSGSRVRGKRT